MAWLAADRSVEVWYLPPPRSAPQPAPALIFTHGNAELIDDWLDAFELPRRWGMAVLLVEYPGYGRSQGSPSERSIRAAVASAYDYVVSQAEVDASRVVVYGRSLGGGAACAIASQRKVAALILESSFTSVRPLARRFGLFGPLLLDPFDNLDTVRHFDGPVLVLHGEADRVIPVAHGRELAAQARRSELHVLPCGHNDCLRPWEIVRAFLSHAVHLAGPPGALAERPAQ